MEIEPSDINTKGYDFYWTVATNGYEWRNQTELYFDEESYNDPRSRNPLHPGLFRYNRNHLFYAVTSSYSAPPTSLYERAPALVDTQPPWLIEKGIFDLPQDLKLWDYIEASKRIIPSRQYQPLSRQTLHRDFAALNINELDAEVLPFAKKNGLLGRPVMLSGSGAFEGKYVRGGGESQWRWRGEIEKMGVLLALWDLIRREEAGALGQLIHWLGNGSVGIRFKWRYQKGKYEVSGWDGQTKVAGFGHHAEIIASRRLLPGFFSEYKRGEGIGPARWFLGSRINMQLSGVSPILTGFRMAETTFVPETLLDALWLLVMLEVYGTIKTCWYCEDTFEPTRKDNVYCSNKCKRMANYYAQQRKGGTK